MKSVVVAAIVTLSVAAAAQAPRNAPTFAPGRLWDGRTPDFRGIWQVRNTSYVNIEGHRGEKGIDASRSIIVDPPDGRLPPLTPDGERRRTAAAARRAQAYDSYENRPLQERCIIYHGVPPLPTGYNNHYQIYQTPGFVTILDENIHDARVIPLGDRPHLPPNIRLWNGDSRGRWEGATLVVETTNYSPKTTFRFLVAHNERHVRQAGLLSKLRFVA